MTRMASIAWMAVDILIPIIAIVAVLFVFQQRGNVFQGGLDDCWFPFISVGILFHFGLLGYE